MPKSPTAYTQPAKPASTAGKFAPQKRTSGTTGVQEAVHEAQDQAQKEAERRNSILSRIAKAVDDAIVAEAHEQIEKQRINHIVNAILECALPKLPPAKKPNSNYLRKEKDKEQEESREILSTGEAAQLSKSRNTWTNFEARKKNRK